MKIPVLYVLVMNRYTRPLDQLHFSLPQNTFLILDGSIFRFTSETFLTAEISNTEYKTVETSNPEYTYRRNQMACISTCEGTNLSVHFLHPPHLAHVLVSTMVLFHYKYNTHFTLLRRTRESKHVFMN